MRDCNTFETESQFCRQHFRYALLLDKSVARLAFISESWRTIIWHCSGLHKGIEKNLLLLAIFASVLNCCTLQATSETQRSTSDSEINRVTQGHKPEGPDETTSSAINSHKDVGHRGKTSDGATETYRPPEYDPAVHNQPKNEDAYILEREPDGRYRIMDRRKRNQE